MDEDNRFTIDDFNKLFTKFVKNENYKPTTLIVGKNEYGEMLDWYWETYPSTPDTKFRLDLNKYPGYDFNPEKFFGLKLVKVDKESFIKLE